MKKIILFLAVCLLPSTILAANFLLVSYASNIELLPLKNDIKIYYIDDDFKLFEIDEQKLDLLNNANIEYEIISTSSLTSDNYLVLKNDQSPPLNQINSGIIIFKDNERALIQAGLREVEKLAGKNFDVIKITRVLKPLKKQAQPQLKKFHAGEPDPFILTLIDQVSIDSLYAFDLRLQNFRTRYTLSDSIYSAGEWIFNKYKSFGYTSVEFDTFYLGETAHRNIIATKVGRIYPDSVIMVGGHYDCISSNSYSNPNGFAPGAEDDGSGTVAALEIARVLANLDFEATIKFAAWDAEELGLHGSYAYAEKAYTKGIPVSFYLNFDMIGYQHPDDPNRDIRLYTNQESRPFAELVADMARTYTTLVPVIPPRNSGGSDHVSFQQFGYKAIFGFEGAYDFSHNPHYHRPTDTVDNMDFEFYRESVQMGLAAIVSLAGPVQNLEDQPYVKLVSAKIDDDNEGASQGNGNGYIDPGETIEFELTVKNYGALQASDVVGTIKTEDTFVTLLDSTVTFGDIPAAASDIGDNKVTAIISPSTPSNHRLKFYFETKDAEQHSWTTRFDHFVLLPQFSYEGMVSAEVSGNGDNKIDPGETYSLSVILKNIGDRDADNIEAHLISANENIVVVDSIAFYPAIAKNGQGSNSDDKFIVTISPNAPVAILPLTLNISEGLGYYSQTIHINLGIGQTPVLLVEDDNSIHVSQFYTSALKKNGIAFRHWDTSVEGMVPLDTLVQFKRVIWYTSGEIRNSLFYAGEDILRAYLDAGGRLFMNGSTLALTLITKPLLSDYLQCKYISYQTNLHHLLTYTSNPVLAANSFWLATSGENSQTLTGEIDPIGDGIPILRWDQNTSEGSGNIQSSGTAGVAVQNATYRTVFFSFGWEGIEPEPVRQNVLMEILSWLQGTTSDVNAEEIQLFAPKNYALYQNYPNPFNSQTKIEFDLPEKSEVEIAIFNVQGQMIKKVTDKIMNGGHHSIVWDGTNSNNQRVSSGIYFCRMKSKHFNQYKKMILIY